MENLTIEKSNGFYTLCFSDGGRRLTYFGQKENILDENVPPIFRMRFLNDDGSFTVYTADSAKEVSVVNEKEKVVLLFSGFDIPMTVALSVECPQGDTLSYWGIDIQSEKQLEWVEYPCVCIKDRFKGKGDAKLLWPFNEGALISDVDTHEYFEPEYPSSGWYGMYPGMVFAPFIACVDAKEGLYFGANSGKDTRQVDFYRDGDGVRLQIRLYPGVFGGNFQSKQDMVLGAFQGDWFVPAEIYRRTFETNKEARFIKINDNKDLPEWYKKSPIILTYCVRGHHDSDELTENKLYPYVQALPIIDEYAKALESPIMVILMHWEGTAPWAPPYVWPPYGGENALQEFIDKMHDRGNIVGVYCSGLGWTQKSNLCEYSREDEFEKQGLAKYMNTAPDGTLPLSKICTTQRVGYDLCISQDFTKETLKCEVEKMANSGLDYIQLMDQNHGGTPYMCYSREHGHPPVPGSWQSKELNKLLEDITKKHKKLLLGCESSAAEPFIPNLLFSDNRYGLNYMYGLPVPLYAYIYHEYVNNFMGNNVLGDRILDCRRDRGAFAYRNAYSFIAGDMMTIVINDEGEMQWAWIQVDFSPEYMPEQQQNKEFVKVMNKWRQEYPEFLHSGKVLATPEYVCQKHRLAIYQGDQEVDTVLGAVYQSSNGEKAFFLVNWTEETQKVKCSSVVGKEIWFNSKESKVLTQDSFAVLPRSVVMVKM